MGMRVAQAASRDSNPNAARWRARDGSCYRRKVGLKGDFKFESHDGDVDGMEMEYGEKESLSTWGHKWVFS